MQRAASGSASVAFVVPATVNQVVPVSSGRSWDMAQRTYTPAQFCYSVSTLHHQQPLCTTADV